MEKKYFIGEKLFHKEKKLILTVKDIYFNTNMDKGPLYVLTNSVAWKGTAYKRYYGHKIDEKCIRLKNPRVAKILFEVV